MIRLEAKLGIWVVTVSLGGAVLGTDQQADNPSGGCQWKLI